MTGLPYLSEGVLEGLRSALSSNLHRYCGDGFRDMVPEPGWSIELDAVQVDVDRFGELDGTDNRAATDLKNTKVVAEILANLPPALAREERIWARLSHVEAFAYCRDRWLSGVEDPDRQTKAIATHFFAQSWTRVRDDHGIARLWWNARIVRWCCPEDFDVGLSLLLKSADIRSNLVERFFLTGRRRLAAGLFRKMQRDQKVHESESAFRAFMKTVNLLGGGIVFEALSERELDDFMDRCADLAADTAA